MQTIPSSDRLDAALQRWKTKHEQSKENPQRRFALLAALKECSSSKDLARVMQIHAAAIECGNDVNLFVASSLVDLYAKCGSIMDAQRMFDRMPHRDIVAWNALMFGYAATGEAGVALELFACMRYQGCVPDSRSFVAALKACSTLAEGHGLNPKPAETNEFNPKPIEPNGLDKMKCLEMGIEIHMQAVIGGCDSDVFVASSLIDMYAKCGSMITAKDVFERMPYRTVVAWNVLILGYAENGEGVAALREFQRMGGCVPDARTFVAALKACSCLSVLEEGRYVEGRFLKVQTLQKVRFLHAQARGYGLDSSNFVSNSLVDMYSKCGCMDEARKVFDKMRRHDVVSWNSLIYGYVENGEAGRALQCWKRMDCAPTTLTFLAALKACGMVGALETGTKAVEAIHLRRLERDVAISCSIVDFYGKCGCMAEAQAVFDSHATKNLASWTSLIAGYSRQGDYQHVFHLVDALQEKGLKPDAITFLCVLAVCNHAGLVEKAKDYFEVMSSKYKVSPNIEHYHCMVDILGKANALDDAVAIIESMPFKPDVVTWKTLLRSCCKWKNVELGKFAFSSLVSLNYKESYGYVLMANMFELQEDQLEQSCWTDGSTGIVHEFNRLVKC